jgi:hypothetical protein
MCLLWGTNWGFISQKTAFFIVTAVNLGSSTSNAESYLKHSSLLSSKFCGRASVRWGPRSWQSFLVHQSCHQSALHGLVTEPPRSGDAFWRDPQNMLWNCNQWQMVNLEDPGKDEIDTGSRKGPQTNSRCEEGERGSSGHVRWPLHSHRSESWIPQMSNTKTHPNLSSR